MINKIYLILLNKMEFIKIQQYNQHHHRIVGNQFSYLINYQRKKSLKREKETLNLANLMKKKNL